MIILNVKFKPMIIPNVEFKNNGIHELSHNMSSGIKFKYTLQRHKSSINSAITLKKYTQTF